MERGIGLQHQREPQHILVLDAVLHQGLRVVDKEVILDDGIDAKAVALVIGELVAEAAGTELDAAYPFLGQAGQYEVHTGHPRCPQPHHPGAAGAHHPGADPGGSQTRGCGKILTQTKFELTKRDAVASLFSSYRGAQPLPTAQIP